MLNDKRLYTTNAVFKCETLIAIEYCLRAQNMTKLCFREDNFWSMNKSLQTTEKTDRRKLRPLKRCA